MRAGERAETPERPRRRVLVEPPDRTRHLRLDVVRIAPSRPVEHTCSRDRPTDPLQADPVEELLADTATSRRDPKRLELPRRGQLRDRSRGAERRDERREPARKIRV